MQAAYLLAVTSLTFQVQVEAHTGEALTCERPGTLALLSEFAPPATAPIVAAMRCADAEVSWARFLIAFKRTLSPADLHTVAENVASLWRDRN